MSKTMVVIKLTKGIEDFSEHMAAENKYGISAIGIHLLPEQEKLAALKEDGEILFIYEGEHEVLGYKGTIKDLVSREKEAVKFLQVANEYGSDYYNYAKYPCIVLTKYLEPISQIGIEFVIETKVKQDGKPFDIHNKRASLTYLFEN